MEYVIELYRTVHHYVTVEVNAANPKAAVRKAFALALDDGDLNWDESDPSCIRVNTIDGKRPEGWVPTADILKDKLTGIAAMEG
jgi:hypothetical protein